LTKIIIKEENFKWHLEAFASELFIYTQKNYQAPQPKQQPPFIGPPEPKQQA